MGLFGGGKDEERTQRGAEERERARREREARRAAREGRPAPPPAPPVERRVVVAQDDETDVRPAEPAAAEPFTWDEPAREDVSALAPEPPAPVEPPAPAAWQEPPAPAPPAPAAWQEPPAPEPPAPEPTAEPFTWDEPAAPPAERRFVVAQDDETDVRHGGHTDEHDVPVGVKRVAAPDPHTRVRPAIAAAPQGGGGGPRGPRRPRRGMPGVPQVPRSRRGPRRLLLALPLLVLAAVAWFYVSLQQPFAGDGEGSGSVRVQVPAGLSAGEIGDLLEERGVVDSSFFFGLRARLSGDRDKLRAGNFTLARDMSYAAALDALTTAPAAAKTVTVTVPEGRSRRETLPIIRDSGLRGDYLAATKRNAEFDLRERYGAPRGVRDLEGFLFPATYELRKGASVRDLVNKQLATFGETFAKIDLRAAKRKNLTPYDVVVIASMIEREAALDRERRLISAVIYNRLKQGIPLGIDATIRFRLNQWSQPLKVSELNIKSGYNTRTRQGLPPGPIGNPGLKSLQAAANPARSSALYYVVKPCGNGAHAFSDTDAEFQEDVAAYNRARDARGGRDPSTCK